MSPLRASGGSASPSAASGWTPDRSTLLNILVASAFVIRPLAKHIKRVVLAGDIVGTDETRLTRRSRLFTVLGGLRARRESRNVGD